MVKVLVVGSGGREHALAWKLSQSGGLTELHAAPGNPGIAVFGPGRDAARIEGSKSFAKEVMDAAGVATTPRMSVARPPCVVKVDGLAAGKGAFVCRTQEELDAALKAAEAFGQPIVIEELVDAEEVSIFALCDGARAVPLPAAQDYKRVGDSDTGPNTGGMGCYSPYPGVSEQVEDLVGRIHRPVIAELARRGTRFVGVLYAGVFLTDDGPVVFEFNCRFGDPEMQVILPRVEGDLLDALTAAARGDVGGVELEETDQSAVTVVIAAKDYPAASDSGSPIDGVAAAEAGGALVFHAGTAVRDGRLVTNGGRILNVTAVAGTIGEAREHAYAACDKISFAGAKYRRDIALSAADEQARV